MLRTTPSTLLYRSMARGPELERFATARLPQQLGEFLYCVRVAAQCEQLARVTGRPRAWLDMACGARGCDKFDRERV